MQTKEFYNISHFGVKFINFCLCSKNVITNYRERILISFTRNHSSRVELSFQFIFQPYTCCSTTIYGYLLYFLVHIIIYGFCIDSDGKSTFKSLGSSQGNTCLCFLLFWFQYCLSLQKIKPLYTSLKRGGGGGGENKALYNARDPWEGTCNLLCNCPKNWRNWICRMIKSLLI